MQNAGSRWRAMTDGKAGVLLLLLSALAFSTAGIFARAVPVGVWAMVFWRNAFGCIGVGAMLILTSRRDERAGRRLTRRGWAAIVCSAGATICYLAAFAYTSVADVAIIYATAPVITALLAWATLGERPGTRTLAASALALVGVVVTTGGALGHGAIIGDGLAFAMTVALSCVAVLARGGALPPLATAFGSALLAAVAVVPPALWQGANLVVSRHEALWLAVFGIVTMTLALPAYLAGAARVSAGRAMLISAAEMPFAPVWVWLGFGERPPLTTLIGGALVASAVIYDLGQRR